MKTNVSWILLVLLMSGVVAAETTTDTTMEGLTPESLEKEISDLPLRRMAVELSEALRVYIPPPEDEVEISTEILDRAEALSSAASNAGCCFDVYQGYVGVERSLKAMPLIARLINLAYAELDWTRDMPDNPWLRIIVRHDARKSYIYLLEGIPAEWLKQPTLKLFEFIDAYQPPQAGEVRTDCTQECQICFEARDVVTRYVLFETRYSEPAMTIRPVFIDLLELARKRLSWVEQAESVPEDCLRAYQDILERLAELKSDPDQPIPFAGLEVDRLHQEEALKKASEKLVLRVQAEIWDQPLQDAMLDMLKAINPELVSDDVAE